MIKAFSLGFVLRKSLLLFAIPLLSLLIVVGLDFSTYQALTNQQKIFSVRINETSEGHFQLTLTSNQQQQKFKLNGDEWQIDFRLIRFTSIVTLSGIPNLFQPSRLSNRYIGIDDQKNKPLNFYSLREFEKIDSWSYLRSYDAVLPFVDSVYGSSVYMPMADGAEYEILIGFSGLVVKSVNNNAKTAVQNWQ
jgi:hypothetical protein